ncbi:hypothetical protein AVEN_53175-1 [Araneus ventricosus]|uniref:Uncharacterized protein n=1 Tax=Araneus ventricosus TaxID=182803 RepID=A0A4Y2AAN9_ARAVE|nr:hypothetical protein AVEN_53175-1 [Araneus ventricosus]
MHKCLIGNKYRPFALPASIDASEYNHIHNAANEAGLDASLLDNHFLLDTNLLPPRYVLQTHNKTGSNAANNKEPMNKIHQESEESNWPEEEDKLVRIIQYGARIAIQEGLIEAEDVSQSYLFSGVHTHLRHALKLSKNDNNRIICIVRQFEVSVYPSDFTVFSYELSQEYRCILCGSCTRLMFLRSVLNFRFYLIYVIKRAIGVDESAAIRKKLVTYFQEYYRHYPQMDTLTQTKGLVGLHH